MSGQKDINHQVEFRRIERKYHQAQTDLEKTNSMNSVEFNFFKKISHQIC